MKVFQNSDTLTRRDFVRAAAAGGSLLVGTQSLADEPRRRTTLRDVHRVVVVDNATTLCGLPRQGGIKRFGGDELALLYWRASRTADAEHDLARWPDRAEMVLSRSRDGGATWPADNAQVVWSNAKSQEQRAEFLCQDPARRSVLGMLHPDAMFIFGRTPLVLARTVRQTLFDGYTAEWSLAARQSLPSGAPAGVGAAFQLRSVDRGRHWEGVPLIMESPSRGAPFWLDNHPPAAMPDGSFVTVMESDGALWLYGSESQGMAWQYLSRIALVRPGGAKPTCAGLILLPDGRLQCYFALGESDSATVCLAESDDCYGWSSPRTISAGGDGPWPLRLQDGRLVVVFAQWQLPSGLAVVVSQDDGRSWSPPTLIRDDLNGLAASHPVAVELGDGRIFAACGARSITGTIFQLA